MRDEPTIDKAPNQFTNIAEQPFVWRTDLVLDFKHVNRPGLDDTASAPCASG